MKIGRLSDSELEVFQDCCESRIKDAFRDYAGAMAKEAYHRGFHAGCNFVHLANSAINNGWIHSDHVKEAYYESVYVISRHFIDNGGL